MAENEWYPAEVERDCYGDYQCTYHNKLGEEHVHTICRFFEYGSPRSFCWDGCRGDWPACKRDCLLLNTVANDMLEMERKHEKMPPYDPFNFMLNHTKDIDDHNYYVETFDTLDGTHWEISVDIERQILDHLDEDAEEDENTEGDEDTEEE